MRELTFLREALLAVTTLTAATSAATAQQSSRPTRESAPLGRSALSLAGYYDQDETVGHGVTTKGNSPMKTSSWEIDGPVFLRSADPEPYGEGVIKNFFTWETTKGSDDDDDFEYEFVFEYGFAPNHEFILEVPFDIGDGHVEGNGDIEQLGWHWRLWEETDSLPAFAMRNIIRVPTGVDSSGVDYLWRGLFTKTLIADKMRLHLNPFVKSVNGDNEEDARHFQWGTAIGTDYRLADNLNFIADYIYSNGEEKHTRDNHRAEFGLDWEFAEHQIISFATQIGLDGDSHGPALGLSIAYIFSFGG